MCVHAQLLKTLPLSVRSLKAFDAQTPHPIMTQNRTRVSRHGPATGQLEAV